MNFTPNSPFKNLFDLRYCLKSITDLFSIMAGETITANTLQLIGKDEFKKRYNVYGICNFPKFELNILKRKNFDTVSYLRQIIFKLSDIPNLEATFNSWFENYDNSIMAMDAYARILLDDDLKVFTPNKFLAVTQLIEARVSIDEKESKKLFDKEKKAIMTKMNECNFTATQKNLIKEYCKCHGKTFKEKLDDFFEEALKILFPNDDTANSANDYEDLINEIIVLRNAYTHSSLQNVQKTTECRLMQITSLIIYFYRIISLEKIGFSSKIIHQRFSSDRYFQSRLKSILDIEIPVEHDMSKLNESMPEFDKKMRYFNEELF